MRALVVVANPNPESFGHALAAAAVDGLRAAGHHVDVIDLYAVGFQAAMSTAERQAYHTDTPIVDPQVAEHAELVGRAELLVFVYPTWWSGLPAILKGWLERVLVPGVGFRFDTEGRVRPGLPQVRRIVGISTYGSPRAYVTAINDNGRRTLARTLRLSCGWRARPVWLGLYRMDARTDADRAEFAAHVRTRMARL
ncbi:MAG TPA: NAD(P)H-dependent oxidoreductase [Ilumatobacter sp.]|nr:NAD(P)H-dependent oxidoreductase [Ilumatobacter sp.]